MADVPLDTQERLELCDLLDELGPSVPTLLEGWTAHDLAAHIVLRERDLVMTPIVSELVASMPDLARPDALCWALAPRR